MLAEFILTLAVIAIALTGVAFIIAIVAYIEGK